MFRVRMVELIGDVRRDVYLLPLGIGDEQVQEAAALTRQLAKGVEHSEEASLLTVHSHGEPDGGRLFAHLRTSEEAATRLVGDEGLDALYVFSALYVRHLEGVALYDVAHGGINRNRSALAGQITAFETGYVHPDYGMIRGRNLDLEGHPLVREGNAITIPLQFVVDAGSFGWANETIELP